MKLADVKPQRCMAGVPLIRVLGDIENELEPPHRPSIIERLKVGVKLCYRCGTRHDNIKRKPGRPTAFERHDVECLARATESDRVKRLSRDARA